MIESIVRQIEGKQISDIQAGVGSIIYIGNTDMFFTIYCSWRLRRNNEVIVNWHQEQENDVLSLSLDKLKEKKVMSVSVNELFDLSIEFQDKYFLDVFADISDNDYGRSIQDNWDFVNVEKDICYSVDYLLNVTKEKYT